MRKIDSFPLLQTLVIVTLCAALFSFSRTPGAHSFQVYLDDKLMFDRYIQSNMDVPTLSVNPAENHRQLIIKYNECGRPVTGRMITIKNSQNIVLKDWRFDGATSGYKDPMVCAFKDIIALKQKGSDALKIFYSSKEFPEGQEIARVVIEDGGKTALK
jgi:hypothetical protein